MAPPDNPDCTSPLVVLLVDDEPLVRRMTGRALAGSGYTVLEAAHGAEALELLRAGHRADVVVSDVMMPRMNGVELTRVLRREFPALPVILMSGYAGLEELPAPIIRKPFAIPDLVAVITESLPKGRQDH